ncbi:DUF4181 domain-containing protein [Thalassorhabdus alkalitolerans]|uniref:DUF4181 domain-containing protein n=1 Tax=Thalassorhabdus alkalitolerans TaxID=2282697 RepID=UPI0036DD6020
MDFKKKNSAFLFLLFLFLSIFFLLHWLKIILRDDGEGKLFMYGTDLLFWVNLIILLSGISLLFLMVNAGMRKWLNLKKKPWFTNDYVNDTHKKIDSFFSNSPFLGC